VAKQVKDSDATDKVKKASSNAVSTAKEALAAHHG
jgi:hypothetical protein